MRGYLSLFLALNTIGCVKVTETVVVYADATTPDGGQEPADADPTDIGFTADSGLSDAGDTDATPLDSGPSDSGETDTGREPPADGGDAGESDAAPTDSGILDAAEDDAAPADMGIADAAPADSGLIADTGSADAGILDDCQLALGLSCATFEEAYLKASNIGANDQFGYSAVLSSDGNTLAASARYEDSNAVGVNGNQADNSVSNSGAVYVFVRNGTTWTQQAYLKASNTGSGDYFGNSLALSSDGTILAIAAVRERSSATGVNGNQSDNTAIGSGAVYIFVRNGTTWTQQAYLKASNGEAEDWFGFSLALNGDGSTLAVGASQEDSGAAGVNGNQADNSAMDSGAVYIFARSGATWIQQAYLKASNTETEDHFGWAVAMNNNGDTLAVGAIYEDSNAVGVNGNQADNSAVASGAVYVFTRNGTTWTQQAYVKASNTGADDYFGFSVVLSGDGNTMAVNAPQEGSNATGVNGNQIDNSAFDSGAVYIFSRNGSTWVQQIYLKASNTGAGDSWGRSVALSGDGTTLAVGAYLEDSNATGVNGNQADNSAPNSGAVYLFRRGGTTWTQQAYLKASTTGADDYFGFLVALSGDGTTLAVGAHQEDSAATGVNGNQADNSALESGAVYVRRIAL